MDKDDQKCQTRYNWLGDLSAFIIVIIFSRNVWNLYNSKNVQHISYFWVSLQIFGYILWVWFSWINNLIPSLIMSFSIFILGCIKLGLKIMYDK